MYAIKMNEDKSLETTVHSTIYQNEKNSDTLVFLIPRQCGDVSMAECSLLLRYMLPGGTGKSEELEMDPLPYSKEYYRYRLKVNTRLTAVPGKIQLWLCAVDMRDDVVLKSGVTELEITPSREITDYMAPEDLNQLDRLALKVEKLEKGKADGITVNDDGDTLQLTANDVPIGNSAKVNTNITWGELDSADDLTVSPEIGSISATVSSMEDGASLRLTDGDVDEPLTLIKSIRIKGASAGFRQNYRQEAV